MHRFKIAVALMLLSFPLAMSFAVAEEEPHYISYEVLSVEAKAVKFTYNGYEPLPESGWLYEIQWDFGDGNGTQVSSLEVLHNYANIGAYNTNATLCETFETTGAGPFCREPVYVEVYLFSEDSGLDDAEIDARLNYFRTFLGLSMVIWSLMVAFASEGHRRNKFLVLVGIVVIFLSTMWLATDFWRWFLRGVGN